jgi:hypothetical protein
MKVSKAAIIKAIRGSGGIMSTVAKKLDVSWYTAKRYIDAFPETLQAYEEEQEAVLDMAEGTLLSSIKNGDVQASKWFLSTKGKRRGFSERLEQTGADGKPLYPVEIKVVWGDDDN